MLLKNQPQLVELDPLASVVMRDEPVFSRDEAYGFLIQHDILMHKEATGVGCKVMKAWLSDYSPTKTLQVLDLACGSKPITIASIMKQCAPRKFHYIGIDINAALIAQAREHFSFSKNVKKGDFFEGDAWNLSQLPLKAQVDIVYSGLHFHHGIPEELTYMLQEIHKVLRPHGLLLVHDVYCPANAVYIQRPKDQPQLVAGNILRSRKIPPTPTENHKLETVADWRADLIDTIEKQLSAHQIPLAAIELIGKHILERDYPLSLKNQAELFKRYGYHVEMFNFLSSSHPCARFFSMLAANLQPSGRSIAEM